MSGRGVLLGGAVVAAAAMIAIGGLYVGQRSLIYRPDPTPPSLPVDATEVALHTEDGLELRAWWFEPATAEPDVAVLFAPGNAGNRGDRAPAAQRLAELGYPVLLMDYRGYGGNPGSPSEEGLALDARAAVRWLQGAGFPSNRVIYVGESLGTGVMVRLATTDPPAALLLRSPYTSMVAVAQNHFPWLPVGLLMSDRFDTMSRLPQVTVPITVMAGGLDDLVPPPQSAAVANAAPNLFRHIEVPDAGHNDAYWYGPDLPKQVDDLASAAIGR